MDDGARRGQSTIRVGDNTGDKIGLGAGLGNGRKSRANGQGNED